MAKIIKVGSQNLTPNKIANPFKTSRNSTTNPFKFNDFEGNALPFFSADVFESTKTQSTSKLRMIASSVTGSMTRFKSSITEPIVNFVRRVGGGISHAWDYAKTTPISQVPGIKHMNDAMAGIGAGISSRFSTINDSVTSLGRGITSKISYLNKDVIEVGHDLKTQWDAIVSKIQPKRISADMSVAEIEQLWKNEIALEGGIA